jgi:apolipoprotein D and lipocalin family protein
MKYPALILAAATLTACVGGDYRDESVPIQTVPSVDLNRYQGLWYEIARFPVSFEDGCVGVTAEYKLNPDGSVLVINSCRQTSLSAEPRIATARAEAADETGAKLKVDFVPYVPFTAGDYWVLDIDEGYDTVVVGTPSGFAGWILARQPQISEARLQRGIEALRRNGYDVSQLTFPPQVGS